MKTKQEVKTDTKKFDNFGHAVSITGLAATRVLTDHFDRVAST
jgi:hypothetical protein